MSVRRRCMMDSRFCQFWWDKSVTVGCVRCSVDERENTASVTGEHKLLGENRGNLCVEEFRWNSTPPVREKTRMDTRDQRRERGYKGLQRTQVVLPVWPAYLPCRSWEKQVSENPLQSDRAGWERRQYLPNLPDWGKEIEVKEKMEERTERESDRRRREKKWQSCWCCRAQQRACSMAQASAEKLEHTGPAEKERIASVPQREQLANTPEPSLPKGKGTKLSAQSTRSWGRRESRWARAAPWRDRGASEREHGEDRVNSMVKKGGFQRRERGQARRASLGEVEGIMSGWVDAKAL